MVPDFHFDEATHIYRLGNRIIPGSTDLLRDAGFKFPDGNMDMGKAVHLATELDDLGRLDESSVTDDIYPYLEGWRKFRAENDFKPILIEKPVCNAMLGFATVLDREGAWSVTKNHVLVEIKKYSPAYFTGIQLALQDLCLPPLKHQRDRVAVELKANGNYQVHWFKNKNDKNLAAAIVSLYHYKRNGG